ncbi:hypothetical protein QQF64_019827 [Cirrhinus molitorella]|uniref:Ig-like domain-containing protein n=1 Tax=Cirrhinus molitorella TaxID=172907 RepID=A0ABR3LIX9_9TELE
MDRSSPVLCHATGFYPSAVTITWLRNGQNYDEDVDLRETLPNEDGTFQKTSTLTVPPDEWEKDQFVCVVEHMGRTIRKILTECKMKSSYNSLQDLQKHTYPSACDGNIHNCAVVKSKQELLK